MAKINRRPGSGDVRPAADDEPRRRRARLRLEHGALAGVLALSGLLELNRLSQNGFANIYYSAAVKSMLRSLHNFFFVSFDPGGLVSVDKPPLGLWLEALSARIFGFAPLPLLVPEALCAMLAVAALYFIVTPRLGVSAGLLSALALAVFPSFVAVGRDNTLDSLLILLMVLACGLALRAIDSGRTRTLVLSALVVGVAFNTKSLAALLCVPGIGLGYLVCAPGSVRRRIGQLALAGGVLLVVAASWSLAVELTPASQRPYVGGSTNNSELQLEFGYNGVGRAGGQVGGPPCPEVHPQPTSETPIIQPAAPKGTLGDGVTSTNSPATAISAAARATGIQGVTVREHNPVAFGSCPSPLRVFGVGLGDQGGWTVPIGVIGLLAFAFVLRGFWRERRSGPLYVFGGWFVIELLFLDFSKGIVHPYYVSALGPALAVMIGAAAVAISGLVRSDDRRRAVAGLGLAAFMALATAAIELRLIHRHGYPEFWRLPLVVLCLLMLLAMVRWRRAAAWTVAGLTLALLVAPALYASSVWDAPVDGTFPTAGPYNLAGFGGIDLPSDEVAANRALAQYIRSHHPTKRFAVLTEASDGSSPLILMGIDAAAMGGYNTIDPALSGDGLARLVAEHQARYVVVGGPYADRGGNAASTAARLVCPQIPQAVWYPASPAQGTLRLVDCAGRAAALRDPYAVADAYLLAHPKTLRASSGKALEDVTGLSTAIAARIAGGPGGSVTVAIGATQACAMTVYRALPATATQLRNFRLPANWYFKITLSGSAAIASVTQR
jgi:4-amino-4-deoxy-L-arabinose transferase-like glycosyltransferase